MDTNALLIVLAVVVFMIGVVFMMARTKESVPGVQTVVTTVPVTSAPPVPIIRTTTPGPLRTTTPGPLRTTTPGPMRTTTPLPTRKLVPMAKNEQTTQPRGVAFKVTSAAVK